MISITLTYLTGYAKKPVVVTIFAKGLDSMKPEDFVTSDTHFGHANIIRYCTRPFASVEAMDRELVDRWNAKVPKNATIYHLGDFSFHKDPDRTLEILYSLNGDIHLIAGNHDNWWEKNGCARDKWRRVVNCFATIDQGIAEHKLGKQLVVLCHYPIESWNGKFHGSWHLHGHSHGKATPMAGRLDVGVDGLTAPDNDYAPWSCAEIVEYFTANTTVV